MRIAAIQIKSNGPNQHPGYLPLVPSGANLLFQLIAKRYERGSIIRGFLTGQPGGNWVADSATALRPPCTRAHPTRNSIAPSTHTRTRRRAAALRPRRTHAHATRNSVAPSTHTRSPDAQQRCALDAHVHTRRPTALRPRRTRAHPTPHCVAPSTHTCTPDAPLRCALGAHAHTRRPTAFAPSTHTRTPDAALRCALDAHAHTRRAAALTPRCARARPTSS